MDSIERLLSIIQDRCDQARSRPGRMWFNEGKMLVLFDGWFLSWLRSLGPGDRALYIDWERFQKNTWRFTDLVAMCGNQTPVVRMIKYGYLRHRAGRLVVTPRGERCCYEYAIRVLLLMDQEGPGDLNLKKSHHLHRKGIDLMDALQGAVPDQVTA